MSGSAGDWPIGPAANPANPAPPPVSTSVASTGIILAHGLPCISTNIAKKNSTPSDSARALSWASASDMARSVVEVAVSQAPARRGSALRFSPNAAAAPQTPVTARKQSGQCLLLRHDRERVRPARLLGKMPALSHSGPAAGHGLVAG